MGIDLLIKIFILFFIKIVNLLLHYAMEDRPIKEKISNERRKGVCYKFQITWKVKLYPWRHFYIYR